MKINYILLGIASIIVVIVMSAKKATKKEGFEGKVWLARPKHQCWGPDRIKTPEECGRAALKLRDEQNMFKRGGGLVTKRDLRGSGPPLYDQRLQYKGKTAHPHNAKMSNLPYGCAVYTGRWNNNWLYFNTHHRVIGPTIDPRYRAICGNAGSSPPPAPKAEGKVWLAGQGQRCPDSERIKTPEECGKAVLKLRDEQNMFKKGLMMRDGYNWIRPTKNKIGVPSSFTHSDKAQGCIVHTGEEGREFYDHDRDQNYVYFNKRRGWRVDPGFQAVCKNANPSPPPPEPKAEGDLIDVKVGPSRGPHGEWTGNTKIIKLPSSCPTFLLDPDIKTNQQYPKAVKNAQEGWWGDRFKLDVQDKTLKINRLDSLNNGWGQDLVLVAKNDGKGCSQPKKLGPPPAPLSGKKNLPKCERRPWSEWSPCNRACAGGEQYRYRSNNGYCFNADKVVFMESEKRACNQQQCPRGETGQKGPKGYRGLRGPTGDRGPRGDPIDGAGYPGDSGDVGNVGEKGKTGLMGPRGEAGYRGPEGKVMSLAQENNEFLTNIYDKLLNFGNNEELEPFNNPDYN